MLLTSPSICRVHGSDGTFLTCFIDRMSQADVAIEWQMVSVDDANEPEDVSRRAFT